MDKRTMGITKDETIKRFDANNKELFEAVRDGNVSKVITEIAKYDNVINLEHKSKIVNSQDGIGQTPLHYAARGSGRKYIEIMQILIDAGADVNGEDLGNYTALFYAARNGLKDNVTFLIKAGADDKAKKDALFQAALNGHLDTVKILLDSGLDANATNSFGVPILNEVVNTREVEIAKYLIEKGADVNHINAGNHPLYRNGNTPLHILIKNDLEGFPKTELVEYLLNAGARTDIKNSDGKTARQVAEGLGLMGIANLIKNHMPSKSVDNVISITGQQKKLGI